MAGEKRKMMRGRFGVYHKTREPRSPAALRCGVQRGRGLYPLPWFLQCGTSTWYSQSLVAKEQAKNLQEDRRERRCRCGCRVTFVSLGGREKRDLSTLGVLACGCLDD
ncbi:uncharacterized protein LOC116754680 isoform X1 [Phocoena sinus]|uniref:uncharacterized protein LOC116754680 isoform X1 n=1 Tax=Phocoena sinus TaxID=42100 RepID=UPI0013C4FFF9|nr:uncharacterized protein LOC116754680 isoform X1 [Phocoena sinus]